MTFSPDLPPALPSMWRLCKLGYRHEPRLMLAAFALSQLAALPDALLALWLMLLGRGVLEQRPRLVLVAAIGLGVSATATWFLRTVSTRVQRRCVRNSIPAPSLKLLKGAGRGAHFLVSRWMSAVSRSAPSWSVAPCSP